MKLNQLIIKIIPCFSLVFVVNFAAAHVFEVPVSAAGKGLFSISKGLTDDVTDVTEDTILDNLHKIYHCDPQTAKKLLIEMQKVQAIKLNADRASYSIVDKQKANELIKQQCS